MDAMNLEIEHELLTHGASLVGFADVTKLPGKVTGGLPRSVSIAVALNPAIVRAISDVTGGVFGFVVVPEPATLSLLILGGFAALRQRRGASKGVSKSFPSLRRYRCSRSMCWESYGAGDHKDSRLGGVICSRS